MVLDIILSTVFSSILVAIIGAVTTIFFGPKVKEKFELRKEFFVPFKKWSTTLYGNLMEFNIRYIKKIQV